MVKTSGEMSLAELEQLMNAKKSQIDTLLRKKERIQEQLDEVDRQIADISGGMAGYGGIGSRPRNAKSLHTTVIELLKKSKKGMALSELADAVMATGYKSTSKNFKNVLYQCLYNASDITHDDDSGKYVTV